MLRKDGLLLRSKCSSNFVLDLLAYVVVMLLMNLQVNESKHRNGAVGIFCITLMTDEDWLYLVHGFGSVDLLREIRKASDLATLPRPSGPKLTFHKRLSHDKQLGYHVPFVFADPSIVRLSQQLFLTGYATPQLDNNNKDIPPTVQFAAYCLLPSLWIGLLYFLYGFVFSFLASSPWGRQLLLRYPEQFTAGVFSRDHPTPEQLQQTSFEVILRSKGYQSLTTTNINPTQTPLNAEMTVVVRGPEPGYVATPRIVIQCALTLLHHTDVIPSGVLTPSAAYWKTDLIDRLSKVDITFEQLC